MDRPQQSRQNLLPTGRQSLQSKTLFAFSLPSLSYFAAISEKPDGQDGPEYQRDEQQPRQGGAER